jgi:hypothetical protein
MRRSLLLFGALALALSGGVGATAFASQRALPAHHPTHSIIVRPVTSAGTAAVGFHIKKGTGKIDCKGASSSPGAVDPNIDFCSPSYQYAIACWQAAAANHALCMRNATTARVYSIKLMSTFEPTAVAKPKFRAPLQFKLAGGALCSIRDGGAWGTLKSHPQWNGTYSCSKHGVVWARPGARHYGINESRASWTVHTGSAAGSGGLTVRHIVTAYFVGTAS